MPVEHSNTRWSKPVGRGRSEVCQLASSATYLGAVAQTKGIRCSHPSCVKGTAVLALNGELRGHTPGGDGKPPDGGTGTMFQVTVTKPRCPPATSAALRAVGRFWELTPPRLRRAGIPIHLAEGQSNARERQVRGEGYGGWRTRLPKPASIHTHTHTHCVIKSPKETTFIRELVSLLLK